MSSDLGAATPNILVGLLVLVLFILAGMGFRRGVRRLARIRRRRAHNLALVLGRLVHGLAILLGTLVAAVIIFPNFTFTSMLQFLGVGSVAAGFAFRDVLQNYLAGMLLLLTEPFQVGDQIVVQSYEGTVEDIQTRATFLRTYDGRRIVIPNAELFTQAVTVNTAFEKRRIEYDLGIGYGDDIDQAKRLILEALQEVPEALPDPPPQVLTYDLAGSAVVLRIRWWIRPPAIFEVFDARDKVIAAIKQKLYIENGIDLPYPTQQILFHDQTEDTDGDRRRQREGWPAGNRDVPQPRSTASGVRRPAQPPRREGANPSDQETP
jgi:small-conductance mechanosensitive channel